MDLIDRQAAIDALKEHRALYCDNTPDTFSRLSYAQKSRVDELDTAIATLVNLPSARPKGKWIEGEIVPDKESVPVWQQAQCSVCGKWHITPYLDSFNYHSFCPFCGAEMRTGGGNWGNYRAGNVKAALIQSRS